MYRPCSHPKLGLPKSTIGRKAELAALQAFLDPPERVAAHLGRSGDRQIARCPSARRGRLADERDVHVVEGRCFEADRALPFAPALDILARADL